MEEEEGMVKGENGGNKMKIAVVTDDGENINQHFGRARYYAIFTIEQDRIVNKELREKVGHHTYVQGGAEGELGKGRHGYEAHSLDTHMSIAQAIDDCEVIIAGGMGYGAYEFFSSRGMEVMVTDAMKTEKAVSLYLEGELKNIMERLD
jgi:predicted Fe-Mo cluster-binding NifX family protein